MSKLKTGWIIGIAAVAGLIMMTGCNLGQQTPIEPGTEGEPGAGEQVIPQEVPEGEQPVATATLIIEIPATNTPVPELLPWETLGPITIDGVDHRTQELVTVRVQRGNAVSNVTCSWVLQGTDSTAPLGAPVSSSQLDENTLEDVYTFTPDTAGTYQVNCTGIASTDTEPRPVNAIGTPFTVEAKG